MTPVVRQSFPKQLAQSHYPDRKQKILLIQKEQSSKKESSYQQKIKSYLDEKEKEIAQKAISKETERRKAREMALEQLNTEKTDTYKQFQYAREASAMKLVRANEDKAARCDIP